MITFTRLQSLVEYGNTLDAPSIFVSTRPELQVIQLVADERVVAQLPLQTLETFELIAGGFSGTGEEVAQQLLLADPDMTELAGWLRDNSDDAEGEHRTYYSIYPAVHGLLLRSYTNLNVARSGNLWTVNTQDEEALLDSMTDRFLIHLKSEESGWTGSVYAGNVPVDYDDNDD